jgi:MoaA/NifB/PqqE/SkfB family radical SAM enzyme
MIVQSDFYKEFEIDLTTSCNLKCPLCTRNYHHAQHTIDKKYKNGRNLSDIIQQLDTFPNLNRCMLAGAISEPTLYKDLFGFIEYLNDRNIIIEMYTNGDTHDDDYWFELGNIMKSVDAVHFTICGSTQELHEKYRVNSNLSNILSHSKSLRRSNPIDFCQYIVFNYNEEDSVSPNTLNIMSQFSNKYYVQSEGRRRMNKKVYPTDIAPIEHRNDTINMIFDRAVSPSDNKKYKIDCKFFGEKKIFISASGQTYPCYTAMEHNNMEFVDGYDYTDIFNFRYPDCFLCESKTRRLIDALGLDFVC